MEAGLPGGPRQLHGVCLDGRKAKRRIQAPRLVLYIFANQNEIPDLRTAIITKMGWCMWNGMLGFKYDPRPGDSA
jgi:hypothetical protein